MHVNSSTAVMAYSNQQPIGIFDSGIGGLSIAQCVQQNLPTEHFIYIADSQYAPYGNKSIEVIQKRVNQVCDYLISQQVKAIVIACNTATVNAIDQLRTRVSVPIIGVEPAIKPASLQSKSKKIGILVTQATAQNQRFLALVEQHKQDSHVIIQACPGLVEQIELGELNTIKTHALLKRYIEPLLVSGVDTLVLGCTHYPFLINAMQKIVGNNITIMETAQPVTEQLARQLNKHQLNASDSSDILNLSPTLNVDTGTHRFLSTRKSIKVTEPIWNIEKTLEYLSL